MCECMWCVICVQCVSACMHVCVQGELGVACMCVSACGVEHVFKVRGCMCVSACMWCGTCIQSEGLTLCVSACMWYGTSHLELNTYNTIIYAFIIIIQPLPAQICGEVWV